MEAYKREFIQFLEKAGVLRFGDFTAKSGRKIPYFINAGMIKTGEKIATLGEFYARAYAETAKNAGLDGIVCSPLEAGKVHDRCGKNFLTVTPGVRFADGDVGDQKRVMTPAAAKAIGSDYIVVGRPITAAADPVAAYERCIAEFCD